MLLRHSDLEGIGLCDKQLDVLREIVTHEPFTVQEAVDAYLSAGEQWTDIVHAYQALVLKKKIPDTSLIWRIARIIFREQPEENASLRKWADKLGPDNWQEAQTEAVLIKNSASATMAHDDAFDYDLYKAAYAAEKAAGIADADIANDSTDTDSAAYAAVIADAAVSVVVTSTAAVAAVAVAEAAVSVTDVDVYTKIKNEIIQMVLNAVCKVSDG
jgi:hypothetical protein